MPKRQTIAVSGITCVGCEHSLENALRNVPGIRRVEADHVDETVDVVIDDDTSTDRVGDAMYDAGYERIG